MRNYLSLILGLSFLIVTPVFAATHQATNNYQGKWWLNVGAGIGGASGAIDGGGGLAGNISGNYVIASHQLLTVRGATGGAFLGNTASDAGILYGVMEKRPEGYVSASAGVAYVHVTRGGLFQPNKVSSTVGVPLEIQAFLTPFKYFGIGVIGFGDLNTKVSFGGAALAIQIGDLK